MRENDRAETFAPTRLHALRLARWVTDGEDKLSVLDDIYDAVADEEALARLPAALASGVGSRSCVIQLFGPDGRLADHQFSYFSAEHFEYYSRNELYKFDKWVEIGRRSDVLGKAFNSDDFIDPSEFRRSIFYNELFRTHGDDTARTLGSCFSLGDHVLTVGLHRGFGDKAFEADQLGQLRNITGHLRRLFVTRIVLERAKDQANQLASALDAPLIGIIRVDVRGRLVHANSTGQNILDLGDGIALLGQTVVVHTPSLRQRFAESVRTSAVRSDGRGDAMLIPRPSGKPPWRVIVTPDEAQASGHATLLIESAGGDKGLRARLAALYELTQAESEVATLLAEGIAPAEIAYRRGVSLDTVRNQIKALLQKTGATGLRGLIALFARTVRTRDSRSS
jgi:DNA-binding CsgD family transcriptional regulator